MGGVTLSADEIEQGLLGLAALVEESPELQRELEACATVFFAGGTAADYEGVDAETLALRRQLEGFLEMSQK